METPSLATPTKKLGTLCLEDKENHQPEEKTAKKSEKKVDKFPVPKIAPETGDDGPREPLSPKKGFKVNTSSMPAYMRATASSSVKKTNTKRNLTDKLKGPISSDSNKKTGIPSNRPPSDRPGSSRPVSARPGSARPVSARPTSTRPVSARPNVPRPASARVGSKPDNGRVNSGLTRPGINKTPATTKTSTLVRPPSATPGSRKPISNLPNRPVVGRPQPSSSTNTSTKPRAASEKVAPSKWDRLATPKQKSTSVRRPATDVKPVSKRPEIRPKTNKPSTFQKTKPNAPKVTSTPAQKPAKLGVESPRTPRTPKNPTKLEAKETIGQKSCPAKPKQARRRTRFSVNNIELKENLKKWHESEMGQLVQNQEKFWNCLSNEDSKSATAKQVLEIVENTCQQLSNMKLPNNEKFAMMEELPTKFQFIEVKTFACYWKWYAELSIKCGQSKEKVIEIIQKGKEEKAQPLKVLEDFFEQYLARLRDEPELGEGKQEQDPEMTLFHDLDDDEDLELSVVFDPPHDDVFNEPSPIKSQETKPNTDSHANSPPTQQIADPTPEASKIEHPTAQRAESTSYAPYIEPPTMEQSTIMNPRLNEQSMMVKTLMESNDSAGPDGSYFRFVVRKKKAAGDLVLTPVRRSKRNQAKTNKDGQIADLKEGDAIDMDDVNIEDGVVMDNHVTIIL